jgi:hypothetical protein
MRYSTASYARVGMRRALTTPSEHMTIRSPPGLQAEGIDWSVYSWVRQHASRNTPLNEWTRSRVGGQRASALPAQIVRGDGRARVPRLLRHLLPRRFLQVRWSLSGVPAPDRRLQAGLLPVHVLKILMPQPVACDAVLAGNAARSHNVIYCFPE